MKTKTFLNNNYKLKLKIKPFKSVFAEHSDVFIITVRSYIIKNWGVIQGTLYNQGAHVVDVVRTFTTSYWFAFGYFPYPLTTFVANCVEEFFY